MRDVRNTLWGLKTLEARSASKVSSLALRAAIPLLALRASRLFWGLSLLTATALRADETQLPAAKPIPQVQVVPLPHDEASFLFGDRELTRYCFGPDQRRPFWYPIRGVQGRPLTRMGHPHDPYSHSHHNSVWISHQSVGGVNFWEDHGAKAGRIVHQRVEEFGDGPTSAFMLTVNAWQGPDGKTILLERRRAEVRPQGPPGDTSAWQMWVDLQLEAPPGAAVEIGQSGFGPIGVRMAKSIGINDGGGRLLNSAGRTTPADIFRKPARWVDYSGPITNTERAGITLMDHPSNPDHPTAFHVREDGWMGICLTLNRPLSIEPGKTLRLRYGLWVHPGVPSVQEADQQWRGFAQSEPPPMQKGK